MLDWDLKVRTHSNTNAITADPPRDGETKQGWWQYIGRYGTNNTSGPSIYQNGMAPPSGPFTQAQIIGNETVTWQINTFDSNGRMDRYHLCWFCHHRGKIRYIL